MLDLVFAGATALLLDNLERRKLRNAAIAVIAANSGRSLEGAQDQVRFAEKALGKRMTPTRLGSGGKFIWGDQQIGELFDTLARGGRASIGWDKDGNKRVFLTEGEE